MDLDLGIISEVEKRQKKKLLLDYLYSNLKNHNFWAYRYFFCELLALFNVIGEYFLSLCYVSSKVFSRPPPFRSDLNVQQFCSVSESAFSFLTESVDGLIRFSSLSTEIGFRVLFQQKRNKSVIERKNLAKGLELF